LSKNSKIKNYSKKEIEKFENKGLLNRNVSIIKEQSISQQEVTNPQSKTYELLLDYIMGDAEIAKEDIVRELIKHFDNIDLLKSKDYQGHNPLHWAAEINSSKAWIIFRNILDQAKSPAPLREQNHFEETPWDIVLQSTDLEFLGDVLLDELARNPNSAIINNLIKQDGCEIKDYKNNVEFVFKYIEHRAVLDGNISVIKDCRDEAYQNWKLLKENKEAGCDAFINSAEYRSILKGFFESDETNVLAQHSTISIKEHIQKALNNPNYTVGDESLSNLINHFREEYSDWRAYKLNDTKDSYQIEYFMRTPEYLSLLNKVITGGNVLALNCLNKTSNRCSIKELLEDKYTDQAGVKSCELSLFKQTEVYRCFIDLGYGHNDILKLAEKHVFDIARSGALTNVTNLFIEKFGYKFKQIETFISVVDNDGLTPLYVAEMAGHLATFITGLKLEVDPIFKLISKKLWSGGTILHNAARNGHLGSVIISLKKVGFEFKQLHSLLSLLEIMETPMHLLAKNEEELKKFIIECKEADFSIEEMFELLSVKDMFGQTPFHNQANNGESTNQLEEDRFLKQQLGLLFSNLV